MHRETLMMMDRRTDTPRRTVLQVEHSGVPGARRAAIGRAVHAALAVQVQTVRGTDGHPTTLVTAPNTAPLELHWTRDGGERVMVGTQDHRQRLAATVTREDPTP